MSQSGSAHTLAVQRINESIPDRDTAERRALLLQHGSRPTSYVHMQQDVRYFGQPGIGFTSYYRETATPDSTPIVFAPPVCEENRRSQFLDALLGSLGGDPVFVGMDQRSAEHLAGRGYAVNDMGTEFNLQLGTFAVRGRAMKHLRTVAHLGKRGVEVHELGWSQVEAAAVREVSREWLASKRIHSRELRLVTRPPVFADEWRVRKFYAFRGGRLIAFAFFDPIFASGKCIGYCANILRARPGLRPSGVLDYLVLSALERFRSEGCRLLSLGMAPLHGIEPRAGERRHARLLLQLGWHLGGCLYSFRGLAFHKERYRGARERTYMCVRGHSFVRALWMVMLATRCLPDPRRAS